MTRRTGELPPHLKKRFAVLACLQEYRLVRSKELCNELASAGVLCSEVLVIDVLRKAGWVRIKTIERDVWWVAPEVIL